MSWDGTDRRNFVRVKLPCEIVIHGINEHSIAASAEDIGIGGIRFSIKEKLEIFSVVDLDIYAVTKDPIVCKGRVIWTKEKKDSSPENSPFFDTGVEFYKIKEADIARIKRLVTELFSE